MKTMQICTVRRPAQLKAAAAALCAALILSAFTARGGRSGTEVRTAQGGEVVTQEYTVPAQALHMISFGAYEEESAARVEAARYVGRGTAGYIYPVDRLYVVAAGYDSREDAERVAEQIESSEGIVCQVLSVRSEPVSLQMTGTQRQIQTLVSSDATLRQALGDLQQLSFVLDSGEADYLEVSRRLEDAIDQTALAASQLRGDYALSGDAIGAGYLRLLNGLASSIRQFLTSGAETTLAFSSRIKYACIDNRLAYIDFLNGLTGTAGFGAD